MKLRILFACLVIMLSVSTVALGTIEFTPYWTGVGDVSGNFGSSQATATASGEQDHEYSHAHGSMWLITTEGGDCEWFYYIEAKAWAVIDYDEALPAWAEGEAEAEVDLSEFTTPPVVGRYAYASVFWNSCSGPPDLQYDIDGPYSHSVSYHSDFEPYQGIYGDHYVTAEAYIYEGSDNYTKGFASAGAIVDLDEPE